MVIMKNQVTRADPAVSAIAEKLADLTFELLDSCREKQERFADSLDLTVAEFRVLRMFGSDEVLSVGEVAVRLGLSSSRLTRILDGLVKKRIVARRIAAKDRRMMELSLTSKGKKIQENVAERYVKMHADIVSHLPDGTSDAVVIAMARLRDAMKEWSGPK
jgi:DNA-binding MarR family transcriptional regulator